MRDRDPLEFISDIVAACEEVLAFTDGVDFDTFVSDRRTYLATLWDIRLIGEAAMKLPKGFKDAHPQIPWSAMIGMRHHLTHGYADTDDQVVWDTIRTDIPRLLADLRELLKRIDDNSLQLPPTARLPTSHPLHSSQPASLPPAEPPTTKLSRAA